VITGVYYDVSDPTGLRHSEGPTTCVAQASDPTRWDGGWQTPTDALAQPDRVLGLIRTEEPARISRKIHELAAREALTGGYGVAVLRRRCTPPPAYLAASSCALPVGLPANHVQARQPTGTNRWISCGDLSAIPVATTAGRAKGSSA
jgi:hypothetical protein